MRKDIIADAQEMLEKAGVKNVYAWDGDGTPGRGIHEMGTKNWKHYSANSREIGNCRFDVFGVSLDEARGSRQNC